MLLNDSYFLQVNEMIDSSDLSIYNSAITALCYVSKFPEGVNNIIRNKNLLQTLQEC